MLLLTLGSATACALVGIATGWRARGVVTRWCPGCGASMRRCPQCEATTSTRRQ